MNINGSLSLVLLNFYINNTYSRMYLQYIADNATFFDLAGCPKNFKVPVISCVVCFLCDGTHSPAHPSCGSPKSNPSWPPKMASGGYDNSGTLGRWCYDFAIQQHIYIYKSWVLNDTF